MVENWPSELDTALKMARNRLRWRVAWHSVAGTFFVPVLAAAAWVGLARFTLFDMPRWPSLLFVFMWLVFFAVQVARAHVTTGHAARFLDHALGFDERVATCVELEARARVQGKLPAGDLSAGLFVDTAELLSKQLRRIPTRLRFSVGRSQVVVLAVALVALVLAIALPSPLDAVRAEQASLNRAVQAQVQTLEALKAGITSNPELSDDMKSKLLAQLDNLDRQLRAPDIDRTAMLAALADAQLKLRDLSPNTTSDYDGLVQAALTVQSMAVGNSSWTPSDSHEATELGRAGDAAAFLADQLAQPAQPPSKGQGNGARGSQGGIGEIGQLSNAQTRSVAQSLDRASAQAASDDDQLAQKLSDASKALWAKSRDAASLALHDAARRFHDAAKGQQTAQVVDNALSRLDTGRQSIAQAGKTATKRAQVGFRRRGAPGQNDSNSAGGRPGSANDQQGASPQAGNGPDAQATQSDNSQSGLGQHIGQNVPAYGGASSGGPPNGPSSPPTGGQPGGQSGQSSQGNPSSGAQSGGASPNQTSGGTSGGGTSSSSTKGSLQGPVNGPVGGASGAISLVPNPAGNGSAPPGQTGQPGQAGKTGSEGIYVPGKGGTSGAVVAGQAAPEPRPGGVPGRVGDGGSSSDETAASPGQGGLATVHTPYTDIIGQYTDKAMQALDREYIPTDAKEYVKEYFTELGK